MVFFFCVCMVLVGLVYIWRQWFAALVVQKHSVSVKCGEYNLPFSLREYVYLGSTV